jgi:Flp pilus assembly protein TadB
MAALWYLVGHTSVPEKSRTRQMSDFSADLAREEYRALRATIRQRGNLRVVLFVATLIAWGAMVLTLTATIELPLASLLPLLVLVCGFEAVASLHIAVERIGRYIQVHFEGERSQPERAVSVTEESSEADVARDRNTAWHLAPMWERTAMAFGRQFPGTGSDPLFSVVFVLAAIVNYAPVVLTGAPPELAWIAALHVLFIVRLIRVRNVAARQRTEDLARFQKLL